MTIDLEDLLQAHAAVLLRHVQRIAALEQENAALRAALAAAPPPEAP